MSRLMPVKYCSPHIAASVSRALGCAIVDRGVCVVNGQLRDANALDLDGLIQVNNEPGSGGLFSNPNSIHYRSPYERSDSEDEDKQNENDNDNRTTASSVGSKAKPKYSKKQSADPRKDANGKKTKSNKTSPSVARSGSSDEANTPKVNQAKGGSASSASCLLYTSPSPRD